MDVSESNDLAYRISLTEKAEEQKEGLKRVPSVGGTSQLDLTVPESEFFGNGKMGFFSICFESDTQSCYFFAADGLTDMKLYSFQIWLKVLLPFSLVYVYYFYWDL